MRTFTTSIRSETRTKLTRACETAQRFGFAIMPSIVLSSGIDPNQYQDFLKQIVTMPADVYDKDATRKRLVTYAHLYKPDEAQESLLYFRKPRYDGDVGTELFTYQLPANFNAENSDSRKFAPVPDSVLEHPVFQTLIEAGYYAAPLDPDHRNVPMEVEAQFIRYEPRRGVPSLGTPPTTHQDNDWAFCVFLLEWENVEGPENAFVTLEYTNTKLENIPPDAVLERTLLNQPLDGYCVADTKIAHYVGPVKLRKGSEYGRRTILILSYKPLIPLTPAAVQAAGDAQKYAAEQAAAGSTRPQPPDTINLPENPDSGSAVFRGSNPNQSTAGDMLVFHRGKY